MSRGSRGRSDGPPKWLVELEKKQVTRDAVCNAIQNGGRSLVGLAETLGPLVKQNGLTTSQIRNAYGLVKRMEMSGFAEEELVLLKPKLAYAAARAAKDGAHQLCTVLAWGVDAVGSDETRFGRFVDLFEAILAYHKADGGR
jgi:CRISPR-associated protein Csm2